MDSFPMRCTVGPHQSGEQSGKELQEILQQRNDGSSNSTDYNTETSSI